MSSKFKRAVLLVIIILMVACWILVANYMRNIYVNEQESNIEEEKIIAEWSTTEPIEIVFEQAPSETVAKIEEEPKLISLGEFTLTAYCSCSECCGQWAGGATASGVMPTANHTIAVDTNVIPFGTKVVINGTTYVAEDTGGAIKGNRIDIYFDSHQAAWDFGRQYAEVFVVKN